MFQLRFGIDKIHDSIGKALATANQGRVSAYCHTLSSSLCAHRVSRTPLILHVYLSIPRNHPRLRKAVAAYGRGDNFFRVSVRNITKKIGFDIFY
jgi:hypothetical protein